MYSLLDVVERDVKVKIRNKENPVPNIEVVTQSEIYLLDDKGRRERRICGVIKNGRPCLKDAGVGTSHSGSGRCFKHSDLLREKKTKGFMQRITTAVLKDESELKKAALNSEEIDVYNIDDLLKILYMFLEDHINKNQYNFKKTDVQQAIDLVDMIRKLIETHQKKEQQQINTMIILTVYKGMLDIIGKYVDSQVLEKIKNDISLMSLPKEIQDVEFKETQL